jgi:putative heme transporter
MISRPPERSAPSNSTDRRDASPRRGPVHPSVRRPVPAGHPPLRPRGRADPAAGGRQAVPASLSQAAAWSWRVLVVGAAVWYTATFLARLTLVVVPVILALLLAALLHRPVVGLRRFLPRAAAALAVLLGALVALTVIGWFVAVRIQAEAPSLLGQAGDVLGQIRSRVSTLPGVGGGSGNVVDAVNNWVQSHGSVVLTGAFTAGHVLMEAVVDALLTVFLTLFLLIDGDRIWNWLLQLLPDRARPGVNGAGHRAWHVLSGWITGTAIISLIHAVVIGTAMELLGTPLVLVLAVLVFIGSFIPIIGTFLIGGGTVLVTLATVGLRPALILLAVLVTENLLEGHVYQPFIMGRSVSMHPIAVVLAVACGGVLDGVVGAIIAIPLAGSLSAAAKYLRGIEDIHGNALRGGLWAPPEEPPASMPGHR